MSLIVGTGQAPYDFAPALFGVALAASGDMPAAIGRGASGFFVAAAAIAGVCVSDRNAAGH